MTLILNIKRYIFQVILYEKLSCFIKNMLNNSFAKILRSSKLKINLIQVPQGTTFLKTFHHQFTKHTSIVYSMVILKTHTIP